MTLSARGARAGTRVPHPETHTTSQARGTGVPVGPDTAAAVILQGVRSPPAITDPHPGGAVVGFRPPASSTAARDRFRAQRRRNTTPELALRRLLHARGLRYRVDTAPLPGVRRRADVVFTRVRLAVFVDGCFWHSCPIHATRPKANAEWWATKLETTVARDRDTDTTLTAAGWAVVRVWEHEPPTEAAAKVARAYTARTTPADDGAPGVPAGDYRPG